MLLRGAQTEVIASELYMAAGTVRNHIQSMMRKTQTHSRVELVAWASGGLPVQPMAPVQPSTRILEFLEAEGLDVTAEQRRVLEQKFSCDHECPVHPLVE